MADVALLSRRDRLLIKSSILERLIRMPKRDRVPAPPIYFNNHDLPEGFEHFTGYLLSYVAQMSHLRVDEALEPLDIDSRQFGVMILIGDTDYRSQVAISEKMGLDRTHVVRLIDDLEHLGYVVREKDPNDRRYYRLALTTTGQSTLEQAKAAAVKAQQGIYGIFTDVEMQTFHKMLLRLTRETFPGTPEDNESQPDNG